MSRAVLYEPQPLPLGADTANPDDIPSLVDALIDFINTSGLTPEIAAAHTRHLSVYIHPFVDGNGHTSRMLLCDLLMRAGYSAPTLVSYIDNIQPHKSEWSTLLRSVLLGERGADELVSHHLRTLLEAQANLANRLKGSSATA
jgi:Fic family protein